MGVTTWIHGHTSDVECHGILSCDCSTGDQDSPKRLLRLSNTDKLNQITVSRNFFPIYYIMWMRYYIVFRSYIMYSICYSICIIYYLIEYSYFVMC